ncbi:MAG: glycosyltransferase family 4 protein [Ruminococcus sp.]|nr:glycosyltransferase family 4 protein [Ruminococcus sp.]
MKKAVINGRGLGGSINGIPRYIHETVLALDKVCPDDLQITLVIPEGTDIGMELERINVVSLPNCPAWDYLRAERYAKKQGALYINLGSKGVWYRKSIVNVHDIRPLTLGDGKLTRNSVKTKIKFGISYFLASHRAAMLTTDSKFCKKEILGYSHLDPKKVRVIGAGWEHIERSGRDDTVFGEFGSIRKKEYYLAVSSIAPHKNFSWIVENAKLHPDSQYVIVGKTDPSVWLDETDSFKDNVLYLGYQSDERLTSLLENARALVFPSLYEGFGMPPMEALACGTGAVVSDIEVLREIYGDTVSYIDPKDPSADLGALTAKPCASCRELLRNYSWHHTALKWLRLIDIFG